jgi:hypothetical protein
VVQQTDLADATTQQRHQHGDPHGLLITEPAVLDSSAEQPRPAHDLCHGVVVDDLAFEPGLLLTGQLTAPREAGVRWPEPRPARFGQRRGRRVLVLGHEQGELLDIAGQTLHRSRRQPLPATASAGNLSGAQVAKEVQHESTHLGGVIGQARPVNPAAAREPVELLHRHDPAVHARVAQPPVSRLVDQASSDPGPDHWVAVGRHVVAEQLVAGSGEAFEGQGVVSVQVFPVSSDLVGGSLGFPALLDAELGESKFGDHLLVESRPPG